MPKIKTPSAEELASLMAECEDLSERIHAIARSAEANFTDPQLRGLIARARFGQAVHGVGAASATLMRLVLAMMANDEMRRDTETEMRKQMAADDA